MTLGHVKKWVAVLQAFILEAVELGQSQIDFTVCRPNNKTGLVDYLDHR